MAVVTHGNIDPNHGNTEYNCSKMEHNFQKQIRDTLHKAWKTSKVYFLDSTCKMDQYCAGDEANIDLVSEYEESAEETDTVEGGLGIINEEMEIRSLFNEPVPEETWFSEIEKYHYPLVDDVSYEAFHTIIEKKDKTLLKMIKGRLIEQQKREFKIIYACFFCQKWINLNQVKDHISSKEHEQRHLEIVDNSINIIKPDHTKFVEYWTHLTLCQPPGDIMRLRCQKLLKKASNLAKTSNPRISLGQKLLNYSSLNTATKNYQSQSASIFCIPHPKRDCKSKCCQQHRTYDQQVPVATTDVGMQWPELSRLKKLKLSNEMKKRSQDQLSNQSQDQLSNQSHDQLSNQEALRISRYHAIRRRSQELAHQVDMFSLAAVIWITAISCTVQAASVVAAGPEASVMEMLVCTGVTAVAWITACLHCHLPFFIIDRSGMDKRLVKK